MPLSSVGISCLWDRDNKPLLEVQSLNEDRVLRVRARFERYRSCRQGAAEENRQESMRETRRVTSLQRQHIQYEVSEPRQVEFERARAENIGRNYVRI